MKEDYGFQLSDHFDFETYGGKTGMRLIRSNLVNLNRLILSNMPIRIMNIKGQLRDYQIFLLENTDGAYLFYDEENETKTEIFYELMKKKDNYITKRLTFEELNEIAEEFFRKLRL